MSNEKPLDLGSLIQLQENEFEGNIIDDDSISEPESDEETDDDNIESEETTDDDSIESDEETDDNSTTDDGDDSTDISPSVQHFNFAKEQGMFIVPEDFKFDGTSESLEEAYRLTDIERKKQALSSILSAMSPDFQDAFKYAISGGSFNDFLNQTGFINGNTDYDLSSKDGQINAIKAYYKETTKYSDDKIDSMIERLEKLEALEEESEDAVEYLKDLRKQKATELAKQQEESRKQAEIALEEQRKALESAVDSSEFIPSTRKNKVKSYLNNIVTRDDGENTEFNRHIRNISSNVDHKAQLADIILSAYDPNKGFDLSRYIKQGKTQATSDFKKSLEDKLDFKGKMSGKTYKPSKEVSWAEILKQYD